MNRYSGTSAIRKNANFVVIISGGHPVTRQCKTKLKSPIGNHPCKRVTRIMLQCPGNIINISSKDFKECGIKSCSFAKLESLPVCPIKDWRNNNPCKTASLHKHGHPLPGKTQPARGKKTYAT